MRVLVTGSSGHLGEGLCRVLSKQGSDVRGMDVVAGPFTSLVGSITDRAFVRDTLKDVQFVIHTATLHKPHVATHSKQDFIDTNISGTLNLLEEAVVSSVRSFVFTSTTSAFGAALSPPPGSPAAWIDEDTTSIPKNIYGVTKTAAEDLCQLFHRKLGLPCIVLRTSRFFPEEDDNRATRDGYASENTKANEFLFRRVDLEDAVQAHLLAMRAAERIGFSKYVISATTPFTRADLTALRVDPSSVVAQRIPEFQTVYQAKGYRMFGSVDRVYVSAKARRELGWQPQFDFSRILDQLSRGAPIGSMLAQEVGKKGYHRKEFSDGPYPVS